METINDKELHRIAITSIIYRPDGKFLVTRRSLAKKAHPGRWTVPGGGLTTDDYISETPFHNQWYHAVTKALMREVKEETGLEIADPKYLTDLTFIRPDGIPVLVLSYYARYVTGEVVLDEDTIDFKWITPEEAKGLDLIEGIAEEIADAHEILTKEA